MKGDAFDLEVIKSSIVAISDEMFASLRRTSKSPIIYEVLDFACGLTDARGDMIAQGNGVTGFLGTLSFAVRSTLEKFGEAGLAPGDLVIVNDPYGGGGSHLSDVSLVQPVFHQGSIVGFSASKAHWTEVGGKDPGSWTTDSTEIYQEGLQFPCVKIYDRGAPIRGLIDLIAANVRLPDMTLGDLEAQAAAMRLGERRFRDLFDKHGRNAVLHALANLLDHGERMTGLALQELPKGVFEAEDWIDDDGIGNGPFETRVKVTITDDSFVCDFAGTHPQVPGPVNCTATGLHAGVRSIFKAVTTPELPANEGNFRPLQVLCPPATIFTAERPAPVSTYWETKNHVTDLVWKALAPVVPRRLPAGHHLSVCGTIVTGKHPETGEFFLLVEPQVGGWGAAKDRDGQSGQFPVGDGETYVVPVEVAETKYGVMVERFELHAPSAGAGRQRGGRGCIREYRVTSDEVTVTATFGRHEFPPWAVAGGRAGSPNEVRLLHADGREVVVGKCARYRLRKGEVVRLVTGTGGGWGSPMERSVAAVVEDVRNGYVSREEAERDYGVAVDESLKPTRLVAERRAATGLPR